MRRVLMTVTVIALFAGCKKDEKAAGGATATETAAKTADPATAASPEKPSAEAPAIATPSMGAMSQAAAGPRPASVTAAHIAVADKLVVAMEAMGKSLTAAGSDCKAAAAALISSAATMKPVAEQAEKLQMSMADDAAAEAWFKATYGPKMMGAMGGMMGVAQTCGQDPGFMAAMEKMGTMMGGGKKHGP